MILKELISDFLDTTFETDLGNLTDTKTLSVKSITKSSKDLTMIFPVMVSNTVDGISAQLIARALERKFVSLAQILLSAISITKSTDAIDHLKNIHSNIDQGSIFDIDDYMNMNVMDESVIISQLDKQKVCEDYRLNFFSMDNIKQSFNEDSSNNNIKIGGNQSHGGSSISGGVQIGQNSKPSSNERRHRSVALGGTLGLSANDYSTGLQFMADMIRAANGKIAIPYNQVYNNKTAWGMPKDKFDALSDEEKNNAMEKFGQEYTAAAKTVAELRQKQAELIQAQQHTLAKTEELNRQEIQRMRDEFEENRRKEQLAKERSKGAKLNRFYQDRSGAYLTGKSTELHNNEIKKSNELQPTLLKIYYIARVKDDHIRNEAIVGIKAKMYSVDSRDIIDKIVAKRSYSMSLYNLIKATTGEIEFWRDFVFAIKKAKIDALSNSNRGSSHSMWKVLERRAIASKLNRFASMRNDATAITTLVMSKYDVEMLKKEEDINILDARVARKIMDDYNLIGIVVDDASTESARFIFDTGDDEYEVYTYKTLKKEDKIDYKQMIELMAGR